MGTNLKEMLENTCNLFDLIDKKLEIMKKAESKGKLSDILKFELVSFMCCLSACDGRMSRVEAQLIRDNLGLEMYPIHIKEFNHENNIGSEEYYNTVPQCLKLAVKIDNNLIEKNKKIDKGISEIVIELFKIYGKEMVVSDNKVTAEEQVCWGRYITMMMQYLVDNSLLYKQKPQEIPRPGTPIEVNYEMSLDKIGRIYTVYVGTVSNI